MDRQEGSRMITPQMHTELSALIGRYDCGEITDEEWALLQIHMAYCGSCKKSLKSGTRTKSRRD
jgi:hypothetical protein